MLSLLKVLNVKREDSICICVLYVSIARIAYREEVDIPLTGVIRDIITVPGTYAAVLKIIEWTTDVKELRP
jgi:hypothetical protein